MNALFNLTLTDIKSIPFVIVLLSLFASQLATGQSKKRIEVEGAKVDNLMSFQVVPISEDGLVQFSEVDKGKYSFVKYDANLEKVWSVDCSVNPSLSLIQHTFDGRSIYLLLGKYRSAAYQIIKLNIAAGFAEKYDIQGIDRLDISEFKASQHDAYVAGKVKTEPLVLHINLLTKRSRALPIALKGMTEVQAIDIDKVSGLVNIAISVKRGKDFTIVMKSFASEGQPSKSIMLEPTDNTSLLTGKLSALSDSNGLVIGTYGIRTSKYTQGLFISKVENSFPVFSKYYSFTDFKNFFKFMTNREQQRIERKIKQKKQSGSELKLEYRLLVHDIIQKDGQYIMVAEAYYPEYRYQNYNNMYGSPFGGYGYGYGGLGRYGYSPYGSNNNTPIFDGWVYTHAVVAGFDMNGKLLWDNSFEINDVKTFTLKEKVKVNVQQEQITLLYSHNGYIKSKIIKENDVIEGVENIAIETDYEGDKVKKNFSDELEYWYGNYFAAWGYQKIRNTGDQPVKSNRNVFYVNKIAF